MKLEGATLWKERCSLDGTCYLDCLEKEEPKVRKARRTSTRRLCLLRIIGLDRLRDGRYDVRKWRPHWPLSGSTTQPDYCDTTKPHAGHDASHLSASAKTPTKVRARQNLAPQCALKLPPGVNLTIEQKRIPLVTRSGPRLNTASRSSSSLACEGKIKRKNVGCSTDAVHTKWPMPGAFQVRGRELSRVVHDIGITYREHRRIGSPS